MLNKVLLIGRLTKDPVITYLPKGTPVVDLTIAYNRRYRNQEGQWQEETHFFDVKAYGKPAEDWATRFSKGYMVLVEGRLVQEKWEREGKKFSKVRIVAESIKLISRPKGTEEVSEEEETISSIEEEIKKLSDEEVEKPPFDEEDEIPF
ncbi:MAG TPA: single-stranded DNA-binding protein [Aquificaceae bacterium]|nr:single-stranded DNA-binding protein [Aquificaceae bacterium]HIQ48234.1 single-stranded DNA-binding protein [Aquifex aeolicus]